MAIKTPASLKSFFEQGDRPTEAQFIDLIDSTYSGEIGAAIVSAASAGNTGLLQIDSASAISFLAPGSAGRAVVTAGTPASIRTVLSAASAGDGIFQIGTVGSVRSFIEAASTSAATTASAGLIEIATTAEVTAGTDATRAVTPAGAAATYGRQQLETEQATTSGTEIDFTSIPSWARKITFMFDGVSTSSTGNISVQIGDSGGVATSGYVARSGGAGNSTITADSTSGFVIVVANASYVVSGHMVLTHMSGNTWIASHSVSLTTTITATGGGTKTLSGALDRVRLTVGSGNFDAGAVNILIE